MFISIPLIKLFGPSGAAFGTTISLTAGNILFMNWYYQNRLGIDIKYFWSNIVRFIPAFILPTIVGIVGMNLEYDNVLKLGIGIVIYAIVFCLSMYFLGMNEEEKAIVDKPIRKVFHR